MERWWGCFVHLAERGETERKLFRMWQCERAALRSTLVFCLGTKLIFIDVMMMMWCGRWNFEIVVPSRLPHSSQGCTWWQHSPSTMHSLSPQVILTALQRTGLSVSLQARFITQSSPITKQYTHSVFSFNLYRSLLKYFARILSTMAGNS